MARIEEITDVKNAKMVHNKSGKLTYKLCAIVGYNIEDGKKIPIRKYTQYCPTETSTGRIRKELQIAVSKWQEEANDPYHTNNKEHVSFDDLAKEWDETVIADKVMSGRITSGCRDDYKKIIRLYASPVIGKMAVSDIDGSVIEDLIIHKMLVDGKSNKTIRNCIGCLHQLFKYAYKKKKLIRENPCEDLETLPPKPKKLDNAFTADQAERFVNEALLINVPRSHEWKQFEDRVFFTLAIDGGFRKGELCALKWNDIDFQNYKINIDKDISYDNEHGEYLKDIPKTDSSIRKVYIDQPCILLLTKWKKQYQQICLESGGLWKGYRGKQFDNNYIFIRPDGERISSREPLKHLHQIIEAYNTTVPKDKQLPIIRVHDLRHSKASIMNAAGIDAETIKRALGHSDENITKKIYIHGNEEHDKAAARTMGKLLNIQI